MRGSQAPPEHCSCPQPQESLGWCSQFWPDSPQKTAKRRICTVSRAAERPNRPDEALAAQRGRTGARWSSRCTVSQEPAGPHGTNGLIRGTVRRSTAVGNAVPFRGCPQLLAGGRPGALSSHAVRVLRFRPRRPSPLHEACTANAGPELPQTASTPVLSSGRLPEELYPSTGLEPGSVQSLYSRV